VDGGTTVAGIGENGGFMKRFIAPSLAIVGAFFYVCYETSPDSEARLFGGIWSLSLALLGLFGLLVRLGGTIGVVNRRSGTGGIEYGLLCSIAAVACWLLSRSAPVVEMNQLEVVAVFLTVVGPLVMAASLIIQSRNSQT
jgi:hypothetical protein